MADRAGTTPDIVSGTCALESWQVCWATCTGPTHLRHDVPREDAVSAGGLDGALVVAVSDGHGMARSFRAHIGSQLAADLAVAEALAAQSRWREPVSDAGAAQWLAEDFTNVVLEKWRAQAREHQQAHPFTAAELASAGYWSGDPDGAVDDIATGAGASGPGAAVSPSDAEALVAYGTTLLVAMAADRRVLAWQLGDGDLVAAVAGHPAGPVVPDDPTLFGNRTTSLCLPDAERQARTGALQLGADPVLLVIASDGFGNAMVAGDWQQRLGADLHERLSSDPFDETVRRMPGWAQEAAAASGDDVTVALLIGGYQPPASARIPPAATAAALPPHGREPRPAAELSASEPRPRSSRTAAGTARGRRRPRWSEVTVVGGWGRRRRVLVALGAALLVCAAVLVAARLMHGTGSHQPVKPTNSPATTQVPARDNPPQGSPRQGSQRSISGP